MRRTWAFAWLLSASTMAMGCNAILGFDQDYKTSSGSGVGGSGAGNTGGNGGNGTGGNGTGGNGTGGNGTGGMNTGGTASCMVAEDCPAPANSCSQRVCDNMVCRTEPTAAGTEADTQTAGDCGKVVCDGTGSITLQADATDVPAASDECHVGSCDGGPPHQVPIGAGNPCSSGGMKCDGAGACVECVTNSDCAGGVCSANVCAAASCGNGSKDGSESDTDCGGSCGPSCGVGETCNGNGDCQTGYCSAGSCALVPVGSSCSSDSGCASGYCVGSVCCSTSCLGACNECSTGTCMPVGEGQDPTGACSPSVCDGFGNCGVCTPGENIGECCMPCAKGPQPQSAVPGAPNNNPQCCMPIFCGPNGLPPDCLIMAWPSR